MNELQVKQLLISKLENKDYFIEWGSKMAIIFNKRTKKFRIEVTDGTYSLNYDSDYEIIKVEINTKGMHERVVRLGLPDKVQMRDYFKSITTF